MSFDTSRTASDGFEPLPDNNGVGLSDPDYSSRRRQMLDLINRLQSTGVQGDLDLPTIAVIGSQSAGKSSLIESICGITLPRASGTCTRCPIECRLSSSTEEWKCVVTLRFTTDVDGQQLGTARNMQFGDAILDKSDVEDRIRKAQRAILNPSIVATSFLERVHDGDDIQEMTFSVNCISLQITGRNVADLSFVDLPGMIAAGSDKDMVDNLVTTYIKKPSCIILLTVACETDFVNQKAFDLAQKFDPLGQRTVGVLTKTDRIGRGDYDQWLPIIRNESNTLFHGWFGVRQPDTADIENGITWREARAQESQFFQRISPWAGLDARYRQQLGTVNLMERLSRILSDLIARRLPELEGELEKLIRATEKSLGEFPQALSNDPIGKILHLVSDFIQDVSKLTEGTPGADGLLQQIRPAQLEFRDAIRATAPNFRAAESDVVEDVDGCHESVDALTIFLGHEEDASTIVHDRYEAIYIDQVMERARQAVTRELPDHYPFSVSCEYIKSIITLWEAPAQTLFNQTQSILTAHVRKIITSHFGQYEQGNLLQLVTTIVMEHLQSCATKATEQIHWLLKLEERPRTLNEHYFQDYKAKFLALYRASRRTYEHGPAVNTLCEYAESPAEVERTNYRFVQHTRNAIAHLAEINLRVGSLELLKLLPNDPLEPALQIMATVRAYFQVAYKRFVDSVPNAIDCELVLGLNCDGRLESVLYKGLGATGPDFGKRCEELLVEPPHIVAKRRELEKKRERLESAKRELTNLWLTVSMR